MLNTNNIFILFDKPQFYRLNIENNLVMESYIIGRGFRSCASSLSYLFKRFSIIDIQDVLSVSSTCILWKDKDNQLIVFERKYPENIVFTLRSGESEK